MAAYIYGRHQVDGIKRAVSFEKQRQWISDNDAFKRFIRTFFMHTCEVYSWMFRKMESKRIERRHNRSKMIEILSLLSSKRKKNKNVRPNLIRIAQERLVRREDARRLFRKYLCHQWVGDERFLPSAIMAKSTNNILHRSKACAIEGMPLSFWIFQAILSARHLFASSHLGLLCSRGKRKRENRQIYIPGCTKHCHFAGLALYRKRSSGDIDLKNEPTSVLPLPAPRARFPAQSFSDDHALRVIRIRCIARVSYISIGGGGDWNSRTPEFQGSKAISSVRVLNERRFRITEIHRKLATVVQVIRKNYFKIGSLQERSVTQVNRRDALQTDYEWNY